MTMEYGGRAALSVAVMLSMLVAGCGGAGEDPEPPADRPASGLHELTLESGGQRRAYLLDVPDSYQPGEPVPLVLVLHPGRGTSRKIRSASRMESFAQHYGVLVAYPEGERRFWRPVREGEHGIGVELGGDPVDVDFLRALVAHLVVEWRVAPGQVYATGHSNGAAMTYRLAAEAADVFAAVAPVGGYLFDPPDAIEPAEPVSVLGIVALAADATPEIAAGIEIWCDRLGCPLDEPLTVDEDDRVTRTTATCADGSEVVEYRLTGAGHVWPDQDSYGVDASRTNAEFFTAHGRKSVSSVNRSWTLVALIRDSKTWPRLTGDVVVARSHFASPDDELLMLPG
ncbi:MAG: hypothetical protein GEV12_12215 [Micromonosporaceae bacterium]|nr:hypothetical protein [Micromonosporaceae bacterium]